MIVPGPNLDVEAFKVAVSNSRTQQIESVWVSVDSKTGFLTHESIGRFMQFAARLYATGWDLHEFEVADVEHRTRK
ncbi:hypothetical protein [Streptomyces sp. NPDC101150]|uniref:hypothetical protein n=1 Tax=Streptomyces sp. NPDC101150 TaxID=3366114 RepID=UPI00380CB96C